MLLLAVSSSKYSVVVFDPNDRRDVRKTDDTPLTPRSSVRVYVSFSYKLHIRHISTTPTHKWINRLTRLILISMHAMGVLCCEIATKNRIITCPRDGCVLLPVEEEKHGTIGDGQGK